MSNDYDPYNPYSGDLDTDVRVSIIGDDDATVVKAYVNFFGGDSISVVSSAKRDPGDPVNHEIGTKLAMGRALRQLGRELLRDAQEGVRVQASVKKSQEEAAAAARVKKEQRKAEVKANLNEPRCAAYPELLKSQCSLCSA